MATAAHTIIEGVLFSGIFLAATAALQNLTKMVRIPYTVALLLLGFALKFLLPAIGVHPDITLSTDVIYYVLLPLLLFESAFHINFHQFQLQFKTITFLATFGLMTSIFVVGFVLARFLGFSMMEGLLFGAIISSTDPISVVALFKELGAPKRLTLLAEGESMFNDATAVIFFRIFAGFVLAEQHFASTLVLTSSIDFVRVFFGSIFVGAAFGYIFAQFIAKIENDRLIETTLTIALAFASFIISEHFFHLSGVIATVAAAITLGNVGRTKISSGVIHFMEEFWEYLAFLGVSLVFFFAAFDMDLAVLIGEPARLFVVVWAVLLARAISVYLSFAITNFSPFFKNEPNVPFAWQHVLNWGGLRGVIPLVLVYSLPDGFALKQEFLTFTMVSFVFSLIVNATTIRSLLLALGLHLPRREEAIIQEENNLFTLEGVKAKLAELPKEEFSHGIVQEVARKIYQREDEHRKILLAIATPKELEKSLRLQILEIERQVTERLFNQNHITERIYFEFVTELDLQQDALEYPELAKGRGYREGGKLASYELFLSRLAKLKQLVKVLPLLQNWLLDSKKQLVFDRLSLLQARIVCGSEAIAYLLHVEELLQESARTKDVIERVISEQELFRLKNTFQMQSLEREYQRWYQAFESQLVETLAWSGVSKKHH